jgi:predicted lipoprotein with Yx(FWY)xxD motif
MIRLIAIGAAAGALLLAGCGGDDDDDSGEAGAAATSAAATTAPATEPATQPGSDGVGTKIQTADSQFGAVLFDGDDRAIYYFDKEKGSTSECYGACAEAWPPVLTEGAPRAGQGAKGGLLGTTERDDGSTQVTYDGHPLYYYVDDPQGEVLCHNVEEFGGLWLAVQGNGQPVS